MSKTTRTAHHWECDKCGVEIDVMHAEIPEHWSSITLKHATNPASGDFCGTCTESIRAEFTFFGAAVISKELDR